VNARDAITGVGGVTIETRNVIFAEEYCVEHPDHLPGDFIELAVSDTGRGIAEESLEHIFEPFFTTKGVGTGLGLATVFGIVKQNDGFLTVGSKIGAGTVFRIYLPRATGDAVDAHQSDTSRPPTGDGETVLLVEDEPAILNLGRKMLECLGYTVLTAGTPWEAIEVARSSTCSIELLITDVVMPDMNGRDLAQRLVEGQARSALPLRVGLCCRGHRRSRSARKRRGLSAETVLAGGACGQGARRVEVAREPAAAAVKIVARRSCG
jgi:two-component system cell cycle sensor histidine kinase/response regulator CckA